MRISLQLKKDGRVVYQGSHDISDAESFGRAMAQVWTSINEARLARTTNVGQLMDLTSEEAADVVDEIGGAVLVLTRR
jgi:hypothetical protein